MLKEESENIKSIPNKGKSILKWVLIITLVGYFGWVIGYGIVLKESFVANAKVNAATQNHTRAKYMITAYFEKCSTGSTTLALKVNSTTQTANVSCNSSISQFADYWAKHFNNDGWKNPYNRKSTFARKANGSGPLGELRLYYSGNSLTMSTNVGDADGGDVYLNNIIVN